MIDDLPEELLSPVEQALMQLTPIDDAAMDAILARAPLEDEELSPRERMALAELARMCAGTNR